jgi:hypothetical protein
MIRTVAIDVDVVVARSSRSVGDGAVLHLSIIVAVAVWHVLRPARLWFLIITIIIIIIIIIVMHRGMA